jgi:ABC-type multidrug transport system fused ATPase/permease subunit
VSALNTFLISAVPILVSVLTFATYTLVGNELTPSVAFTSLALFDVLRMPLFMLPMTINVLSRSSASLKRLQGMNDGTSSKSHGFIVSIFHTTSTLTLTHCWKSPYKTVLEGGLLLWVLFCNKWASCSFLSVLLMLFLTPPPPLPPFPPAIFIFHFSLVPDFLMLEDQEQPVLLPPCVSPKDASITMPKCSFNWDPLAPTPVLKGVELEIKHGQLVTVIGATGHGKSSLLAAILGNMHSRPGSPTVSIRGTVAYVPQQSWVFNATMRDNILFGQPYNASRYLESVMGSQLTRDLELMASGDKTEMGEKGVNLSGGQKQRSTPHYHPTMDVAPLLFLLPPPSHVFLP